jgi:predicted transcriptional regulator
VRSIGDFNHILWKSNAHRVEVIDTLNKNTTVYLSMREAAAAIGLVVSSVRYVLKKQKEKGTIQLIKKRFQVKLVTND